MLSFRGMSVLARSTLRSFWARHRTAEQPLRAWYHEARKAGWRRFGDIKAQYRHADVVAGDRVIFNIGGNTYRLVVAVDYARQTLFIRFIGTHAEYDKIDARSI